MTNVQASCDFLSPDLIQAREVIERFDEAWQGGSPPSIDEFVSPVRPPGSPVRGNLVAELVKIDLEYRWRRAGGSDGATPSGPRLEDYAARLPELGGLDALPVELIGEEYRARILWGDRPGHAEYLDRFGSRQGSERLREALAAIDAELRAEAEGAASIEAATNRIEAVPLVCPHCRQPIEMDRSGTESDVLCPLCGGRFQLDEEVATRLRGESAHDPQAEVRPPFPTIGRYTLRNLLGSGGFGTVWSAWDRSLTREVALKLPRAGWHPGPAEQDRFLREARSVAQLQHPGIVTVHDAGIDHQRGTVFIVSDLVRGTTLARWLEDHRPSFPDAAELTAQVAEALDYAHRHGVVHRDLKPSNILLEPAEDSGAPRPNAARLPFRARILDFGLAKRDVGEVTVTQDGQVLGTPAYMSPEQVRSPHAVDGRTDVYSLGVVLYVLLTGELPFRGVMRMVLHQVQFEEPRPPRKLNDKAPRDLETICLKCLAKEPGRRYATAGELAADLRRYLRGEPIVARPFGRAERTWRWCRRNPVVASLAGALAVVFVAGFAGVSGQWYRAEGGLQKARLQEALALQNLRDAVHIVDLFLTKVSTHPTLRNSPGMQPFRKDLLDAALTYYRKFIEQRSGDPTLRAELANARFQVARITNEIGSRAEALASCQEALRLYQALVRDYPGLTRYRDGLADVSYNYGRLQETIGDQAAAMRSFVQARDHYQELVRAEPAAPEHWAGLARAYRGIGLLMDDRGQAAEALTNYEFARKLEEALVRHNPSDLQVRCELAHTYTNLGVLYHEMDKLSEALTLYEQARGLQEDLVRAQPNLEYRSDLANTYSNLGVLQRATRHPAEALARYEQARKIQEELVRDNPTVIAYRVELARTLNNLGNLDHTLGRLSQALACHERARSLREELVRDNPGDLEAHNLLGSTLDNLGIILLSLHRTKDAVAALRRAIQEQRLAVEKAPDVRLFRQYLGFSYHDLAAAERAAGSPAEAIAATLEERRYCGEDPNALYNVACGLALCIPLVGSEKAGLTAAQAAERRRYGDLAIRALREAIRHGFSDFDHIQKDTDLDPLRERGDFQDVIRGLRDRKDSPRGAPGPGSAGGTGKPPGRSSG